MRKIDLIYNNLLGLLHNLTLEGALFEAFHDGLDETRKNELIDIAEQITTEKTEIRRAQLGNAFYPDFASLIAYIEDFTQKFETYPNVRKNEILAIVSIIQKLAIEFSGTDPQLLENEINPATFGLAGLTEYIVQDNFLFVDLVDASNSLFLFTLSKIDIFKKYIDSISSGAEILYYLLSKLGNPETPLTDIKYVLVKTEYVDKPKILMATLCLHIISKGEVIHKSYEYNSPPVLPSMNTIRLGKKYQQFYDSITIISEYNQQKDILDKYLRLYHVFENFMYKSPLVKLERDSAGNVFSIRDFQRMYDRISDSELNMLKKLIDNILALEHKAGQSFGNKILTEWTGLIPAPFADDSKINTLIDLLNIKNAKGNEIRFTHIKIDSISSFLSKLIYSYRNSMVHNRETEFHLTHQMLLQHPQLKDTACIILEKFLLPVLEEIAFYLIINENDIVWYDKSALRLWVDN